MADLRQGRPLFRLALEDALETLAQAIRANAEEAPTWVDVPWEGRGKTDGVRLVLRVSAHCVRAPVEIEGLGTLVNPVRREAP